MKTHRLIILAGLLGLCFVGIGCSESVENAKTNDPMEIQTYEFLKLIKEDKLDQAWALYSEETRKYFPKEQFAEWVKDAQIKDKAEFVYVTKLDKQQLTGTVFTEFKPRTRWAPFNSQDEAKIKLDFVYVNGQWQVHNKKVVDAAKEDEAINGERRKRADEWKTRVKFHEFKVENKMVDGSPALVLAGELENISENEMQMIQMRVYFLDANGKDLALDKAGRQKFVVFVPVYTSARQGKKPLQPKERRTFVETILTEPPDDWTGEIRFDVFDAGEMPLPQ